METRKCLICGINFVPYRKPHKTCSRKCYLQLDYVKAANATRKLVPEAKDRKNAARRIANNPNRKEINRRNSLKKYGLTIDDYERMFLEQSGVCRICNKPPAEEGWHTVIRLHVDHDHDTGQVRSLLCNNCNRALGYFKDDPAVLENALAYLSRWKAKS